MILQAPQSALLPAYGFHTTMQQYSEVSAKIRLLLLSL